MKFKRTLALILTLAMMVALLAVPAAAAEIKFTDLKNYSWAEESIYRWANAGIVKGDAGATTFRPGDNMKRGEFAKVMSEVLGLTDEAENIFKDLKGNEWYAPYILRCAAAGIMKGSDGKCNAEAPISRQEAFAMFARTLGMYTGGLEDLQVRGFKDLDKLAEWAIPETAAIVNYSAVMGDQNGNLNPAGNITRAEVVKILDRIVGVYVDAQGGVSATTASEAQRTGNFVVISAACTADVSVESDDEKVTVTVGETSVTAAPANYMIPTVVADGIRYSVYPGEPVAMVDGKLCNVRYLLSEDSYKSSGEYYSSDSATQYTYDDQGNLLKKEQYEDGELVNTQTAEFNEAGQLVKILNDGEVNVTISYNDVGNESQRLAYQDGEVVAQYDYEYDDHGREIKDTITRDGDVSVSEYLYSEDGQYLGSKETINGVVTNTQEYTYAEDGARTKSVTKIYSDTGILEREIVRNYEDWRVSTEVETYYDEAGNVTASYEGTYTYNEDGMEILHVVVDNLGHEDSRIETAYNEQGRVATRTTYEDEELVDYEIYEYESDDVYTQTTYDCNDEVIFVNTYSKTILENGNLQEIWTYEDGTVDYQSESTSIYIPVQVPIFERVFSYWYAY